MERGMAGLDRSITGNYGEDSVPPDDPTIAYENSGEASRAHVDDDGGRATEPVFIYVDEGGVVLYTYVQWVKIQSELSAGMHDERDYTGKWTVVLEGQKEPEPFTMEPGEEVRYEEPESNEYGHRRVFIKGSRSGAGYCGNIGLLDV